MKPAVVAGAAFLGTLGAVRVAVADEATPAVDRACQTFAIETCVRRTYNYLDTMVDKDGLPYLVPLPKAHRVRRCS